MRRELIWMCVGCLAVAIATPRLCAQNTDNRSAQRNSAPIADRFVSTPGQMVSTPGQMVTGPGQRVMGPGQMVIPPGQAVIPTGSSIAPVPGVVSPFVKQPSSSGNPAQPANAVPSGTGVSPGRNFHNRQSYRPEYGEVVGYVVPYMASGNDEAGTAAESANATESRSMVAVSSEAQPSLTRAYAPSGNRPAYAPGNSDFQAEAAPSRDMIVTPEPALTIVMKDGSRRQVRNYALTPQTLMDLDSAASGREVSIPLSRINLPATEKAASQTGLSFSVPGR